MSEAIRFINGLKKGTKIGSEIINDIHKGMKMDEKSKSNLIEIEKSLGHASGIGAIQRGECPLHASSPAACMFCSYGHMLDCHYPKTCEEAQCSHCQSEVGEDY